MTTIKIDGEEYEVLSSKTFKDYCNGIICINPGDYKLLRKVEPKPIPEIEPGYRVFWRTLSDHVSTVAKFDGTQVYYWDDVIKDKITWFHKNNIYKIYDRNRKLIWERK